MVYVYLTSSLYSLSSKRCLNCEKRKKKINRLFHLPPTIFFTTQREKNVQKKRIKHEKSVKTHMLQRSTTLITVARWQSITIKLRFGAVSPQLIVVRSKTKLYIPKSMNSFVSFFIFQWKLFVCAFFAVHFVAHKYFSRRCCTFVQKQNISICI